jgi:hypothetical protein
MTFAATLAASCSGSSGDDTTRLDGQDDVASDAGPAASLVDVKDDSGEPITHDPQPGEPEGPGQPPVGDPESPPEPEAVGDDDLTPELAEPNAPPSLEGSASLALLIPAVRLSRAEIDSVLRDVLGDETRPAQQVLPEEEFSPYDNDFARQTVSPALVDSLQYFAEEVAARALDDPESRAAIVPCTASAPDDAVCFDQVVAHLGPLFFRAPVSAEDAASYRELLGFSAEQGDFDLAVELLLTSFLQDPEFLYRLERGAASDLEGVLDLGDYEIAARMAFLLWGSGPDAGLLANAASGELRQPAIRRQVAEGLLADDRARTELHRFHAMWLGYRTLPHDPTLNQAFTIETQALIDRAVFEGQSYLTLFDSPETFVDDALAAHYGLPAPVDGRGWVDYPADSGRAGILSHGSVLSSFSKFSDTSPTQRGIFVRTRLLCQSVPSPPAVVDVDQPPEQGSAACKVDRYRAHAEQSGCNECHSLFDPIGFGLENYDMAGRYRVHDDGNPNCPIDSRGSLPGYGEFRGPGELAGLLLDNGIIEACFARQYLSHALATSLLSDDQVLLAVELGAALAAGGDRFDQWLLDFVASDRFARRPEESP